MILIEFKCLFITMKSKLILLLLIKHYTFVIPVIGVKIYLLYILWLPSSNCWLCYSHICSLWWISHFYIVVVSTTLILPLCISFGFSSALFTRSVTISIRPCHFIWWITISTLIIKISFQTCYTTHIMIVFSSWWNMRRRSHTPIAW